MSYLRSTNPTGLNKRVYAALRQLNQYENTPEFKAFPAEGLHICEALEAAAKARGEAA